MFNIQYISKYMINYRVLEHDPTLNINNIMDGWACAEYY